MLITASWLVLAVLALGLGLDLVFGWLVVMHMYLYSFPLSLYRTLFTLSSPPPSYPVIAGTVR